MNVKKLNSDTAFLYLHGFLSSPKSEKASQFRDYCKDNGLIDDLKTPQLPLEPDRSIDLCEQLIAEFKRSHPNLNLVILGSSLGGYYATYLAEKHDAIAVLINPAVRPYLFLDQHIGTQTHYHDGQEIEVKQEHIDFLRNLDINQIKSPERYLVMLQTGDETLNYQQAADFYEACHCLIEAGGNHSFENFAEKIPMIMSFVGNKALEDKSV